MPKAREGGREGPSGSMLLPLVLLLVGGALVLAALLVALS
jgi:hypothetical protein